VLRGVLFVEKFFVHAIGIALARQRTSLQVRQHCWRNPNVVVDDLLLGKFRGWIKNFVQIRQLELLALNLDSRIHRAYSPAGIVHEITNNAKYGPTPIFPFESAVPAV
jgi:hypothetical protein